MEQDELFSRLGIALAIGLLIGLERGWQLRDEAEHQRTAGLRTHALAGLLGGTSAATALVSSPLFLAAAFLAFAAAFTLFSWHEAVREGSFSVTGVVAGILTFTLGAYAVLGDPIVAVASAVAMAVLLALRQPLHRWLRRLSWLELRAVLVLLVMTFLLLPILPDETIDPWNAINPAEIWLLTILVAAISFAGYVAIRVAGDHAGIAVAGIAGGLASSTATTVSLARLAREHPQSSSLLATGILFAGATMMARIAVIVGLLNHSLLWTIIGPVAAAGAALLLFAMALLYRSRNAVTDLSSQLRNPFSLLTVLQLSGLLVIIMILATILSSKLGEGGILALAAVSGLVDVDALTLSMARLTGTQIGLQQAADAVIVCAAVNTAAKGAIAWFAGGKRLGILVGSANGLAIVALLAARLIMTP